MHNFYIIFYIFLCKYHHFFQVCICVQFGWRGQWFAQTAASISAWGTGTGEGPGSDPAWTTGLHLWATYRWTWASFWLDAGPDLDTYVNSRPDHDPKGSNPHDHSLNDQHQKSVHKSTVGQCASEGDALGRVHTHIEKQRLVWGVLPLRASMAREWTWVYVHR